MPVVNDISDAIYNREKVQDRDDADSPKLAAKDMPTIPPVEHDSTLPVQEASALPEPPLPETTTDTTMDDEDKKKKKKKKKTDKAEDDKKGVKVITSKNCSHFITL